MRTHRITALILCMALCLPIVCAAEIMPFAGSGNSVSVTLNFSDGNANGSGRVASLETGCTASITVYVQAKSGRSWINKASGKGDREASASCTAVKGTEYRARAVLTIYNSDGDKVDSISGYSASQTY